MQELHALLITRLDTSEAMPVKYTSHVGAWDLLMQLTIEEFLHAFLRRSQMYRKLGSILNTFVKVVW